MSSQTDASKDSISKTENDNVYNFHKQDTSDVNRDNVKDINSVNRKNIPERNESPENVMQGTQVEITDEQMTDRREHETKAESEEKNDQEQNKLEDEIEQLDLRENRVDYKENIETIEYDVVGDVNTEPVLPKQNEEVQTSPNEKIDQKVHIDATQHKDQQEVDKSHSNEEESDFVSVKVNGNENVENFQESPREWRTLNDLDGEDNLNKVEASYEVLVEQETQPTETQKESNLESHSNSKNEGLSNFKAQDEETERTKSRHHSNDKNIPVEEDLHSSPGIIDTLEVSNELGHSSNGEDEVEESEGSQNVEIGQNIENADEHSEKKLDLPVQDEFIKEMDESHGNVIQDVGDLEKERQMLETQSVKKHENDAVQHTQDSTRHQSSSFYEFEYVERGKDEPESSNSPGVREESTDEDISGHEGMVADENGDTSNQDERMEDKKEGTTVGQGKISTDDDISNFDERTKDEKEGTTSEGGSMSDEDTSNHDKTTTDEKEATTGDGEMLADEGSLGHGDETTNEKEDTSGQDEVSTDHEVVNEGEGTLHEKEDTLNHSGEKTDVKEATANQDPSTMGGETLSQDGARTDEKEGTSGKDGNMADKKESISGENEAPQKNEEDKSGMKVLLPD